jgi:hypothetical protein
MAKRRKMFTLKARTVVLGGKAYAQGSAALEKARAKIPGGGNPVTLGVKGAEIPFGEAVELGLAKKKAKAPAKDKAKAKSKDK